MTPPRFLHTSGIFTPILVLFAVATVAEGREFRVNMVPNGSVFSCTTCHTTGGGSPRNAFGLAVQQRVTPNGGQSFWDADLAGIDSDGDGISNGQELGDPDGDFLNVGPTSSVSNPGDFNSRPPVNDPPVFTSSPVTVGFIGENYTYQASATDAPGQVVTFSKGGGPSWIGVSSTGLVSGTPPENSAGSHSITIGATDNGSPSMFSLQTYTLSVSASYLGFQNLNFNLPTEQSIASPDGDPDNDDLPNIAEFVLKTNPRSPDAVELPGTPSFDGSGRMRVALQVRDDLTGVTVQFAASAGLPFVSPTLINPVVTDPNGLDGFETWTFTDTVSRNSVMSRFGQFRFQLNP